MIVTDLKYNMDDRLVEKLDLMIARCIQDKPKRDALLLIEGGEGEGKTTLSSECGYYIKSKTGRVFDNSRLFFDVEKMVEFAKSTEEQIIVWDEPALDGLSIEWWKETQKDLIKLLMIARKKRHFFIFNITKFYKFSEYIIVDRGLGMIHVYSRSETEAGRFVYIRKKSLEWLYSDYRKSKRRSYKKFASFRGTFPDALEKIINIKTYEVEKDNAILSIGTKKDSKSHQQLLELRFKVSELQPPIKTKRDLIKQLNTSARTLYRWNKQPPSDMSVGRGA